LGGAYPTSSLQPGPSVASVIVAFGFAAPLVWLFSNLVVYARLFEAPIAD
jgi:hypothetical protein